METLYRRGIPWEDLEELQMELVAKVAQDPREVYVVLAEPTPTFTYGRASAPEELLWDDPGARGVHVAPVTRGGRWTYHGPGQILLYPIAFLPQIGYSKRSIKLFLGDLASSVVCFLSSLGLESEIHQNPFGVYVSRHKVASFGVCVRDGISSHGLSLYLKPQKDFFSGIVPCGAPDIQMSSLEELGMDSEWRTAAEALTDYIKRGFQVSKN